MTQPRRTVGHCEAERGDTDRPEHSRGVRRARNLSHELTCHVRLDNHRADNKVHEHREQVLNDRGQRPGSKRWILPQRAE